MARYRHLLSLMDLEPAEVRHLIDRGIAMKANPAAYRTALAGKTLGMVFQKSSTRTRISFEVGMYQLGGHALFLSGNDLQLNRGETVADTARVLSRYVDGIMARVFAHQDVEDLARFGSVPVINGLSDRLHPCQALADYMTLFERKGRLEGLKVVYVGDGNNVAHSLVNGAVKLGVHIVIACPPGYEPDAAILTAAREAALRTGARVEVSHEPHTAVCGADAIYTDVWTSMGQEKESAERKRVFANYQVNEALFARAREDAIFLHCLPAHRGEEVTDGVADHERSAIFDQAENRMHVQKAVLVELLGS